MWYYIPQQGNGQKYVFSGHFRVSDAVIKNLRPGEILNIYRHVQSLVKKNNGIDFLQIYKNEKGQQLLFVDYLCKDVLEAGNYDLENHFCTLKFNYEY